MYAAELADRFAFQLAAILRLDDFQIMDMRILLNKELAVALADVEKMILSASKQGGLNVHANALHDFAKVSKGEDFDWVEYHRGRALERAAEGKA